MSHVTEPYTNKREIYFVQILPVFKYQNNSSHFDQKQPSGGLAVTQPGKHTHYCAQGPGFEPPPPTCMEEASQVVSRSADVSLSPSQFISSYLVKLIIMTKSAIQIRHFNVLLLKLKRNLRPKMLVFPVFRLSSQTKGLSYLLAFFKGCHLDNHPNYLS